MSALPFLQLQTSPSVSAIIILLAIGFLIATAFAIIGLRSVKRNSQSVRLATEAIRQLAAGNFGHRVPVPRSKEVAELLEAVTSATESLTSTIQDLSGERDKLSAVLATMADGVVVLSPDGVVLMLNQTAREMLNLGQREVEGRRLMEVVRDHQFYRLASECLSTSQSRTAEVELFRPRRFLNAVATPLKENGHVGVLLTLHDLTRTRQLEASQKDFVSNVSHELRNPLASVKALVETLEDGAVEQQEVARDFLRRVLLDIDRMNNLVNELLELSRLESGQLVLQLRPLDLTPVVLDIQARFSLMTQEQGVTLSISWPPQAPSVMGDEERVRQVLINLVENAIKFTPSGGRVTLGAQRKSQLIPASTLGEGGDFLEITVEDTGVGVSPSDLPHLFERFYKVDRARHAGGGTGLGLAIVKQIVEAHGGEVWAQSQEGVGSTFGFTLPVVE